MKTLILLATLVASIHCLEWSRDGDAINPDINLCVKQTLTLPWNEKESEVGEVIEKKLIFSGRSGRAIAAMKKGKFLTAPTYNQRARKTNDGGIAIDRLTLADSGNYSMIILSNTKKGSSEIKQLRANVTVHVTDCLPATNRLVEEKKKEKTTLKSDLVLPRLLVPEPQVKNLDAKLKAMEALFKENLSKIEARLSSQTDEKLRKLEARFDFKLKTSESSLITALRKTETPLPSPIGKIKGNGTGFFRKFFNEMIKANLSTVVAVARLKDVKTPLKVRLTALDQRKTFYGKSKAYDNTLVADARLKDVKTPLRVRLTVLDQHKTSYGKSKADDNTLVADARLKNVKTPLEVRLTILDQQS